MNKNESKYFNTAIRMDEALITLLEKKDFEYITIKEICDTAGVNRSTFYLHYENTSDLLKETTQYVLDKHFAYYDMDKKDLLEKLENCGILSAVLRAKRLCFVESRHYVFSLKERNVISFASYCFLYD
jgi:AcrR family transcriptional regulator